MRPPHAEEATCRNQERRPYAREDDPQDGEHIAAEIIARRYAAGSVRGAPGGAVPRWVPLGAGSGPPQLSQCPFAGREG
jgi:hypothetical protein